MEARHINEIPVSACRLWSSNCGTESAFTYTQSLEHQSTTDSAQGGSIIQGFVCCGNPIILSLSVRVLRPVSMVQGLRRFAGALEVKDPAIQLK